MSARHDRRTISRVDHLIRQGATTAQIVDRLSVSANRVKQRAVILRTRTDVAKALLDGRTNDQIVEAYGVEWLGYPLGELREELMLDGEWQPSGDFPELGGTPQRQRAYAMVLDGRSTDEIVTEIRCKPIFVHHIREYAMTGVGVFDLDTDASERR